MSENLLEIAIQPMAEIDWPEIATIYREGIESGNATFTSAPPLSFAEFLVGSIPAGNVVARAGGVVGWARITRVSSRSVYAGVAEVSLYIAARFRGRGVGSRLLSELIIRSENAGVWTLQAGIFPENSASLALHARHGFREVGRRERLGKMTVGPRAGEWRDVVLFERRSRIAGAG